jgi:hypothetical protein
VFYVTGILYHKKQQMSIVIKKGSSIKKLISF